MALTQPLRQCATQPTIQPVSQAAIQPGSQWGEQIVGFGPAGELQARWAEGTNSCVVKCMLPTAWLNSRGAQTGGRGGSNRARHNVMATCLAAAARGGTRHDVHDVHCEYVQQRPKCRRQSELQLQPFAYLI